MWIDRQDLLYTLRSARRAPLLSSIAIVALSLAIGLNAGVFTLLNTMFLTPPTQKDPASFVQLYPRYEGWFTGAGQFSQFTTEDYEAIRTRSKAIEQAAAWRPSSAILSQDAKHIAIALVSCNYFHVFGIDRPLLGRIAVARLLPSGWYATDQMREPRTSTEGRSPSSATFQTCSPSS